MLTAEPVPETTGARVMVVPVEVPRGLRVVVVPVPVPVVPVGVVVVEVVRAAKTAEVRPAAATPTTATQDKILEEERFILNHLSRLSGSVNTLGGFLKSFLRDLQPPSSRSGATPPASLPTLTARRRKKTVVFAA